jgi:hypothetical protein
MTLNPNLVRARCTEIEESASRLERFLRLSREQFLPDQDTPDLPCYRLLVAIEAALALCYHACAKGLWKVPEEYAESFGMLRDAGILPTGRIFQGRRLPLALWFRAIWWVTSLKTGGSTLGLQRVLGLGSYRTAWTWLHKLRRAMVRPGRDRLTGWVEVDESYLGGEKVGKRGREAAGKVLIVVAAQEDGAGIGSVVWQGMGPAPCGASRTCWGLRSRAGGSRRANNDCADGVVGRLRDGRSAVPKS